MIGFRLWPAGTQRTSAKQNLTQAELAACAGIWQRTVSNIETAANGAKVDTILDLEIHTYRAAI
jgi:transcriptional regulator with XRE-family HTH domain